MAKQQRFGWSKCRHCQQSITWTKGEGRNIAVSGHIKAFSWKPEMGRHNAACPELLRRQAQSDAEPNERQPAEVIDGTAVYLRFNGWRDSWEYRMKLPSGIPAVGAGYAQPDDALAAARDMLQAPQLLMYPVGWWDQQEARYRRLPLAIRRQVLDGDMTLEEGEARLEALANAPEADDELPVPRQQTHTPAQSHTATAAKGMPRVTLYTDGSNHGQPGPAGWGALLICDGRERELAGPLVSATNNQAELTAVIKGLQVLNKPCVVDLWSDSRYVVDGLQQYIYGWERRDWRKSTGGEVANRDLWEQLLEQKRRHKLTAHWVKGHSGHPENERVDRLAGQQSRAEKERQERESAPEPPPQPDVLITLKPCSRCRRTARVRRLGTDTGRYCPSCYAEEMAARRMEKEQQLEVRFR